jgi:transcriptional regulator with XRE-family HTH domain
MYLYLLPPSSPLAALAARRRSEGLTQASIAARCGLSPSMLGALERGERRATPEHVARYAAALDAAVAEVDAIREKLASLPVPARAMTSADLRAALQPSESGGEA